MSLFDATLLQLRRRLAGKELSAVDLVQESLDRIERVEPSVKAFITVDGEGARRAAAARDAAALRGEAGGALSGIPMGLKDNIVTRGLRTTCASKLLARFQPIHNATAADKLHGAGAITVGKLNMDEFAMGGSNENSAFHPTRNPWNPDRVPGGSSGGSAAAVAAGEVCFALGSDTGGSIRQPASYCGVVGLKPTYGLVSRFGLVAFASSLDQIGPLARSVEDAAVVLQAIAGHDPRDSTSADVAVPNYADALTGRVAGLRLAVPREYIGEGVDAAVKEAVLAALRVLEDQGAVWEEVSMPHNEYAIAAYYLIASSEASSNLARFDGVRYGERSPRADSLLDVFVKSRSEGFGDEVKRRIMLGTYALSSGYYDAYYLKAQKTRTLIKRDFDNVFARYDLIVGPTAPTPAFRLGEHANDPLTMYLNDIFSIPVNLAGLPAVSVPCGTDGEGMPIGLQLIGKPFDESTVLRAAHAFEQATAHHLRKPDLP